MMVSTVPPSEARPRNNYVSPVLLGRRRAFDEARQTWSSVSLTFEQFCGHLDRLGYVDTLPIQVASTYLCAGCALGLHAACRALERSYFPGLRSVITQRGQSSDFAEDVLQELRARLFAGPDAKIARYLGKGTLAAWLRTVTNHLTIDAQRAHRVKRGAQWRDRYRFHAGQQTAPGLEQCGPELESCRLERVRHLERALLDALAALRGEDRELLQQYYWAGARADDLAQQSGLDRATVYRRLRKAEQELANALRVLLGTLWSEIDSDDMEHLLLSELVHLNLRELPREWSAKSGSSPTPG
jgi:RNA polymerase sigma-70 factor